MKPEQKLEQIREFASLQATDELLWSYPENGKETPRERYLRTALRKLHMVIESDNDDLIYTIAENYKKFLAEQHR